MAGKHQKHGSGNPDKLKNFAFFFFGNSSKAQLILLEESIKQLRKDYREHCSFYFLNSARNIITSDTFTSIEIENGSLTIPSEKNDFLFFLPIESLEKKINFNIFFSLSPQTLPEGSSYSRLFFKDPSPDPPTAYVTGKETAQFLSTLVYTSRKSFKSQLEWYLERLRVKQSDIIVNYENPFSSSRKKININPLFAIKRSLRWNFKLALDQQEKDTYNLFGEKPVWRMAFFITATFIFLLLPVLSYNAGISGDEEKHLLHAEKVYNYFKSGGNDTLALNDPKYKLNFYGQSYDLLSYAFIKTFNIEKIYETRHIFNGIAGALAIISSGVLIRFLSGSFAGFITMLFMFFFPRFMGHSMNNSLDIPFALGYVFSIYQMIRFLKKLPEFSVRHALLLTAGIAFTTSIRIGGLILIPYVFMFSGLYLIAGNWPWKKFSPPFFKFAGRGFLYLVLISLSAYFLSLLVWPYALQDPLKNPLNALDMMSNITVALRVMFEGEMIWSDNLPWYYVLKNMYITIPLVVWIFFPVSLVFFFRKKKEISSFWLFTLYFVTIFPLLYIIYRESNVYGGWRHTLFIYPTFAGISAIGVSALKNISRSKLYRTIYIIIIILGLFHPIQHTIRNYPLQYVYFNEIAGGVDDAYTKYETDYYLNSLKPATEWVLENIVEEKNGKTIIISNAPYDIMHYYYRNHLEQIEFPYTRYYDRGSKDWDYGIFYCNYIDPYQLKKGIWPPKNTIHEVTVDGVCVCAIVKRENKKDYLGYMKLNNGVSERDTDQINEGIELLKEAVEYNDENETALLTLAKGYIVAQEFDKAREVSNSLLKIYPDYEKALNIIAFSYISEGDLKGDISLVDRAINILLKILEINYKYSEAYYNLGLSFYMKGNDNMALNYLNQAVNYSPRLKKAYYLMANIFEDNGDQNRAMQIRNYANAI